MVQGGDAQSSALRAWSDQGNMANEYPSIETWALEEAKRRLQKEGTLPDTDE